VPAYPAAPAASDAPASGAYSTAAPYPTAATKPAANRIYPTTASYMGSQPQPSPRPIAGEVANPVS